jgi:membrane protein DedA with SNARE-associated domain
MKKVYAVSERWGFAAIAIVAVLPPPAPMVAFMFASGALQYSVKKFLFALTLGRFVRYSLLAFLAAKYGRHLVTVASQDRHSVLIAAIALIAVAVAALSFFLVNMRKQDV